MRKRITKICTGILFFVLLCMMGCGDRDDAKSDIQQSDNVTEEDGSMEKEIEETEEIGTESAPTQEKANRIICWGDSLTYGQGGNGVTYPSVLEEKFNLKVKNYGIQGETARQIAIRMGLLKMTVGEFELPSEAIPVEVTLWQGGEDPIMMRLGDCAINPCKIAGVEGELSYRAEDNKYYFTREKAGEEVLIEEGTEVETFASEDKRDSDIVILFAGTNLPPDKNTVGELIDIEQQMIQYLQTERYVVIGLTSKTLIPDIEPINEALSEAFGEHFLDIRSYLLEHGLEDAGLEPSEQDILDLEKGEIPSGIRVDEVHGNEVFYRIIGEQVAKKIEELGYIADEALLGTE